MTPRTRNGCIRHESASVFVPDEMRLEIFRRFGTADRATKALSVSPSTAYALIERGGVIRPDVLERVRERLRRTS